MSDGKQYIVVRDTLSKVYVFDRDEFFLLNSSDGGITITRGDNQIIFGWFAPGKWVSTFIVTDDELDYVTGHAEAVGCE